MNNAEIATMRRKAPAEPDDAARGKILRLITADMQPANKDASGYFHKVAITALT